ncbi:MAG: hypothetical protein AAF267_24470, partial [Deinococcota bacterium]
RADVEEDTSSSSRSASSCLSSLCGLAQALQWSVSELAEALEINLNKNLLNPNDRFMSKVSSTNDEHSYYVQVRAFDIRYDNQMTTVDIPVSFLKSKQLDPEKLQIVTSREKLFMDEASRIDFPDGTDIWFYDVDHEPVMGNYVLCEFYDNQISHKGIYKNQGQTRLVTFHSPAISERPTIVEISRLEILGVAFSFQKAVIESLETLKPLS